MNDPSPLWRPRPNLTGARIVEAYADGSAIGNSADPDAGAWAFCFVDDRGERCHEASGLFTPEECGVERLSSSHVEFLAVLFALESLPPMWSGTVWCDDLVTVYRFRNRVPSRGVPMAWAERAMLAVDRLHNVMIQRIHGHPTRAELEKGVAKNGRPVSPHNVWCDEECRRVGWEWKVYDRDRGAW
jgi:ribonuclease HI